MLEYELWGNTLESWGISILIILGAVVVVVGFVVVVAVVGTTYGLLDHLPFEYR